MKILFHHRIASRDGQSVHIEELTAALTALGHAIVFVGPAGWSATGFGGSNPLIDRIKRNIPGAAYELLELAYNLHAFVRLWAAVRSHRPDVIYERFSLFLFAGIWVRRLTGIPLLLEVNSPLYEERANNDGLKLHRLGRWAQRLLWNSVDMVLPVTEVLAGMVRDTGVSAGRITVIPNGIDPARFANAPTTDEAKRALGLQPGLVLGFTGFIRGWNAVDRIIDVAAEHGDRLGLHVLVVGDGPAHDDLVKHAEQRGVADRLTITGVVGRNDIAARVAAIDIAVIPGLTPYSSPLKLFEYMVLGRAIVAPDTPNIREILTDGKDSVLFDPTSKGAMEVALLRLAEDNALRARIGAAARARVLEAPLTWRHNAERVVALADKAMRTSEIVRM